MLRVAKLTSGIGARIALNILCTSTADVLTPLDHVPDSVANAKKRKTTKTARRKTRQTLNVTSCRLMDSGLGEDWKVSLLGRCET